MLFLCTGNYYRSRFAEEVFNARAPGLGLAWRAESRGLALEKLNPGPISVHTRRALAELQIALPESPRFPLAAAAEDFQRADHVIAVKAAEHQHLVARNFPDYLAKVEFWQVHDLDCAEPEEAIPHLLGHVTDLLARLRG